MFVQGLLLYQEEQNEEVLGLYISILQDCGVSTKSILLSLQEKGIILKTYKIQEGEFDPFNIPINKNFTKYLYKSSFSLGKELFEEYPQFATINGNVVSIRTVAKKFDSLEDAFARYGKEIRWSLETHNYIIELIKWAKEQGNIINYSLASFIINNGWHDLEALKNGDLVNINFDAVKLI